MISFCYFQKKSSFILGVAYAMLVQFLPKQGHRRAIFNDFTDFFSELQYDNTSYKY